MFNQDTYFRLSCCGLRCFIDASNQVLGAKVSIPLEHLHRLALEASQFLIDKIRKLTATSIAHAASIEMYTPSAVDTKELVSRFIRGGLNLRRCENVQKDLTTAECT